MSDSRPKCGGGGIDANSYDLPLHVVALCMSTVSQGTFAY